MTRYPALVTPVEAPSLPPLDHGQSILAMGSCFGDAMGRRLERAKFVTTVNPGGILFNPASIAAALGRAARGAQPEEGGYVEHEGLWHHLDYHGSVSAPARPALRARLQAADAPLQHAIKSAQWLIVTLGTAWVYRYHGQNIVANCHRLPASEFIRERLTVSQIVDEWLALLVTLRTLNPALKVLLTVSPVRHVRDGLRENATSKATLLLASESLVRSAPETYYFPAFEILIDELRDYRFYAEDLVHPSTTAEEIVWQRLLAAWMPAATRELVREVESLQTAMAHEPRTPNRALYRQHLERTLQRTLDFAQRHPTLDFAPEIANLRERLASCQ